MLLTTGLLRPGWCAGGVFKLELFLPEDYPMAPPKASSSHFQGPDSNKDVRAVQHHHCVQPQSELSGLGLTAAALAGCAGVHPV